MARIEHPDARHMWHPQFGAPHFAPLDERRLEQTRSPPAHMPTLGAFMLVDLAVKIKAALLSRTSVIYAQDDPESPSPPDATAAAEIARAVTTDENPAE